MNQISIFYVFMFSTTISTSKKMFSFGARAEKGIARQIDASSVVGNNYFLIGSFWACACKLSWTLLSPARVQPLYGAGRKESSGTGLGSRLTENKTTNSQFMESKLGLPLLIKEMETYSAVSTNLQGLCYRKKLCLSQYHDHPQFMQEATWPKQAIKLDQQPNMHGSINYSSMCTKRITSHFSVKPDMVLRAKLYVRWTAGFGLGELHQPGSHTGFVIIPKKYILSILDRTCAWIKLKKRNRMTSRKIWDGGGNEKLSRVRLRVITLYGLVRRAGR